ncbi:MAG: hypothetical protein WAM39_05585 [Bryobacteraceae bacterium]
MSFSARSEDSAVHKLIRNGAVAVLLLVCGSLLLSLSVVRTRPVAAPTGLYNGAVENQPDIVLMKTAYCVAGPQNSAVVSELHRAVDGNDKASFDDLYAHHGLLTLYPGNVIKPLSGIDNDGAQFVELPQPVAGYVTCWLLGNTIE